MKSPIKSGVIRDYGPLLFRHEKRCVYDSIGNREQASRNSETNDYTANDLNQYSSVNGTNLTYDADGNMLSNGDWTYAWNGENRLITASNETTVLTFKYDYMGRRFSKTVDGSETLFIYDDWNLIQESNNSATNNYVWGLDLSQTLQGAGGVGGLLSVTESDGESYFSAADANGNVMGYIDDAGNVRAVYTYDAFGGIITSSGAKKDDFKFRFSTKYLDGGLSRYDYGYRGYRPDTGRFESRDVAGERRDINLYAFTLNSPIHSFDRLGLETVNEVYCTLLKNTITSGRETGSAGINSTVSFLNDNDCEFKIKCHEPCKCPFKDRGTKGMASTGLLGTCNIEICPDRFSSVGFADMRVIVHHELIHCAQSCRGKEPRDCSTCLCSELQAYGRSNPDLRANPEALKEAAMKSCTSDKGKGSPCDESSDKTNGINTIFNNNTTLRNCTNKGTRR